MVNIVQYWLKRNTSTYWATKNPILNDGEIGYETDTSGFKVGDGVTAWVDIPYLPSGVGPGLSEAIDDRVAALVEAGTGIHSEYDDNGGLLTLSVLGAEFNNQTGTAYTLALTDAGKWVTLSNASAITLTVPNSSTVPFTARDEIDLLAAGTGEVTIVGAGGVTIANRGGRAKSNGQYAVFGLKYLGSNLWVSYGDLKS